MAENIYNLTKQWIYRNARPLEFARWQYHFGNGSQENVLDILKCYQNGDGGFGHGLEADLWNPQSAPIQAWAAMEVLYEMKIESNEEPIIKDILRYLNSGLYFEEGVWQNQIPSNNRYPHASWWHWHSGQFQGYNPTAYFAGFILKYADKNSELYQLGLKIAEEAANYFLEKEEKVEGHLLLCYMRLLEFTISSGHSVLFDIKSFEKKLIECIKRSIINMKYDWLCDGVIYEYLKYYKNSLSAILPEEHTLSHIVSYLKANINERGSWNIPWAWNDYKEEWIVSRNWWEGYGILSHMLFLKYFEYM